MQLIWFRQDLRIHDHAALWHATQQGPCIALAVLSPEQWQLHQDARIKTDFYLRRLKYLKQQLQQLNIPLIILNIPLWENLASEILNLCQTLKIENLHANIEVGVNELERDAQVQQLLEQQQIRIELYHDRTLFPLSSIRNQSNQPYQVYSVFKKKCYERLILDVPTCYPEIETQDPIQLSTKLPNVDLEKFSADYVVEHAAQLWPAEDRTALDLLDDFIEDKMAHYKTDRDLPAVDGTSRLSPYLNIGVISVRQCMQALFQDGYFQIEDVGQQTWLDELLWREFYLQTLFDFPRVSKHQPFKQNTNKIQWRNAPEDLAAWQQGQTGIPIVDAGMRQMLATGWMHNRVRMITAMFLCKNLLIDWRLGESWFMQHLIDGDLAANNGGWQWCASTGMDAVPYFRIFNPVSQSLKFDPNGDYIREWVPELAHLDAKSIHEPYAKNPDLELDYPKPIVDLKASRVRAIEAFKQI
ncbi:DNA photolyase family protein [Acinetobacter variabilis]|uniref:cryptochrome/photolyase family protein n=1 Tax=Acinetobacter variabilis TaxID=70346 RepID=UPI0021D3DAA2|nr:deoxyribodipyrimidine photo-lyase [Acinetobacter variabilis]MCU4629828.1 DNA photolyase family protein [Acinetobacter variabilis]